MKQIVFVFLALLILNITTYAQDTIPVRCGDIIEQEFTQSYEPHTYAIDLAAGTQVRVSGVPLGDTLLFAMAAYAPNDTIIAYSEEVYGAYSVPESDPFVNTGVVAANGIHKIIAYNGYISRSNGTLYEPVPGRSDVGVYTLLIGCTLRDGTVIEPGQSPDPLPQPTAPSQPSPSGFGFPGLPSVDFAQGVRIPLAPNLPNTGSISDGFVGIFGYTLSANAGDQLSLSFTRQGGNLNLGLAVITSNNVVVFESSLMSASILITQFALPVTGEYTIGVYRSALLQPTAAEATTFQITGTLNP